jgi:heptosyltransferase II
MTAEPQERSLPGQILIVAPAWVGDMVMMHGLVQLLVRTRPGARIHVLAPPATASLGPRMPGVAATTVIHVRHGELALRRRWRLGRALKQGGFGQAIVLPNTLKSALAPFAARIPLRTGWHGEARYVLLNDRRRLDEARLPQMIERFMALGLPPGTPLVHPYPVPQLTVDAANRARLVAELGLEPDRRPLALCPGAAFGPSKRWPAKHFAAVARHALTDGRAVWLLGSPGDADACREVASRAPGAVDLAGRTSLVDAVDVLSLADDVVCNDSGLMHVAGAVGARVIAVFGSTSPEFTPPLGPRATVQRLGLSCSPCFERECPLGHLRCLNDLGPERVTGLL